MSKSWRTACRAAWGRSEWVFESVCRKGLRSSTYSLSRFWPYSSPAAPVTIRRTPSPRLARLAVPRRGCLRRSTGSPSLFSLSSKLYSFIRSSASDDVRATTGCRPRPTGTRRSIDMDDHSLSHPRWHCCSYPDDDCLGFEHSEYPGYPEGDGCRSSMVVGV